MKSSHATSSPSLTTKRCSSSCPACPVSPPTHPPTHPPTTQTEPTHPPTHPPTHSAVLDVPDWKRHTEYLGQYQAKGENHQVIKWFWEVVEKRLDEEGRARLLQFVTGGCNVPAQGFKALQSNDGNFRRFNIQSIRRHECIFPRAHTCFNKLDLPLYESKEELEGYLTLVINMEITGFTID